MTGRTLLNGCAGLGIMAAWMGCAAPVVVATVERGHPIDRAVLEGLKRGVTTRTEALALLGEPSTTSANVAEGSTTLCWDYLHSDARGSVATMTILKFGPDDLLQIKMVSQSSQVH